MKPPILFYHIAQMGDWRAVVREQLGLLAAAKFNGTLYLGMVGEGFDRWPLMHAQSLGLHCPEIVARGSLTDYEAPTLRALECFIRAGHDGPVGYFHTKGVSGGGMPKAWWRWLMNAGCLTQWQERITDLETHDLVGVCWEESGNVSHFCGNFWWATSAWLRKLSGFDWYWANPWHTMHVPADRRFAAEFWISSNNLRAPQRRVKSVFCADEGNGVTPIWQEDWWAARPKTKTLAAHLGSGLL